MLACCSVRDNPLLQLHECLYEDRTMPWRWSSDVVMWLAVWYRCFTR